MRRFYLPRFFNVAGSIFINHIIYPPYHPEESGTSRKWLHKYNSLNNLPTNLPYRPSFSASDGRSVIVLFVCSTAVFLLAFS
jgi:hypothetical protein